jgi:transcriptional regulator with XRE-family HTH domain
MPKRKKTVAKPPRIIGEAEIGTRLRLARLERKMSQMSLAAALGVTYQQIQKYESGQTRIASSRLAEAARALKKPVAYFVGGRATVSDDHGLVERMLLVSGGVDLARAFVKLDSAKARRLAIEKVEEIGT